MRDGPSRRRPRVEQVLSQTAAEENVPGFVAAIVTHDGGVSFFADGLARPHGPPLDKDSVLQIGSLTKSLTALMIEQLVDGGKLDLDRPVAEVVPQLATAGVTPQITCRQLLHQTSGIPGYAGFGSGRREERIAELRRSLATAESAVDRRFEYSNANYELLGLVVEHVQGMRYEEVLARDVLLPLGRTHTQLAPKPDDRGAFAWGQRDWFGVKVPTDDLFSPPIPSAGGVALSAADMAKLMSAHLNRGEVDGVRLASERAIAELHGTPAGSSYAMGWTVRDVGGHAVLLHNGGAPAFTSTMIVAPDDGVGIVVLTTSGTLPLPSLELPSRRMATSALQLILGQEPPPASVAQRFGRTAMKLLMLFGLLVSTVLLVARDLPRWRRKPPTRRAAVSRAVVNVLVAILLVTAVPRFFGIPLVAMLEFARDIAVVLIAGATLGLATAILRLVASRR